MYGTHGFTHTHGFSVMICLRVRHLLVNYNFVLHNVSCTLHNVSCTLHILFQLFSDMFPLLIMRCGRVNTIVDELNFRDFYHNECMSAQVNSIEYMQKYNNTLL